jgi:hypothetical protein
MTSRPRLCEFGRSERRNYHRRRTCQLSSGFGEMKQLALITTLLLGSSPITARTPRATDRAGALEAARRRHPSRHAPLSFRPTNCATDEVKSVVDKATVDVRLNLTRELFMVSDRYAAQYFEKIIPRSRVSDDGLLRTTTVKERWTHTTTRSASDLSPPLIFTRCHPICGTRNHSIGRFSGATTCISSSRARHAAATSRPMKLAR